MALTEKQIRLLIRSQRPPKIYKCRDCGDTDLLNKVKRLNLCRTCSSIRTKRWFLQLSPGKRHALYFRTWLKRTYGITPSDYMELWCSQGGKCAICDRAKKLVVDHDHKTGDIRGLLCTAHNRALGNFQDNPEWLDRAAEYLRAKIQVGSA